MWPISLFTARLWSSKCNTLKFQMNIADDLVTKHIRIAMFLCISWHCKSKWILCQINSFHYSYWMEFSSGLHYFVLFVNSEIGQLVEQLNLRCLTCIDWFLIVFPQIKRNKQTVCLPHGISYSNSTDRHDSQTQGLCKKNAESCYMTHSRISDQQSSLSLCKIIRNLKYPKLMCCFFVSYLFQLNLSPIHSWYCRLFDIQNSLCLLRWGKCKFVNITYVEQIKNRIPISYYYPMKSNYSIHVSWNQNSKCLTRVDPMKTSYSAIKTSDLLALYKIFQNRLKICDIWRIKMSLRGNRKCFILTASRQPSYEQWEIHIEKAGHAQNVCLGLNRINYFWYHSLFDYKQKNVLIMPSDFPFIQYIFCNECK